MVADGPLNREFTPTAANADAEEPIWF